MHDSIQSGFEESYRLGSPPWDIGAPQPEIVRLAAEGRIVGDVLDLGCGTGENALHLASLGHRVVGLDGSPTAIEAARPPPSWWPTRSTSGGSAGGSRR
jgi:SAM-dependent methyltransferase